MKIKPAPDKGKVMVELTSRDESMLRPLPFQVQRILVPMDFSDTARKALQYAVPFAVAFEAEVVVVHVLQPFSIPPEIGYAPPQWAVTQRELMESAREGLDTLCVREISARARSEVLVREGVPWQEIVAAAREHKADLIILATHGRTGLKHALLGSVTERVVRHAPCPVLVVRETERDFVATGSRTEPAVQRTTTP